MILPKFNQDNFADLNSLAFLKKLDESFLRYVQDSDTELCAQLEEYRANQSNVDKKEYSEFLVKLAPLLDDFIAEFFDIEKENFAQQKEHEKFDVIYECRRRFIQRYVIKKYTKAEIEKFDFAEISTNLQKIIGAITEQNLASSVLKWQINPEQYEKELGWAAKYCTYMIHHHSNLMLFDVPRPKENIRQHRISILKKDIVLGFDYRDQEQVLDKAFAHSKYCIYCHNQEKDYCSKGIDEEKKGCPLKQKISEMHLLKSRGLNIAALSVIMIDNPLVPITGHRICNDCMKSCIYQKQDPVNTPLVESNILSQVLALPFGVEIYLLLSKWNPLNIPAPLPKEPTGKNVLVVGLGPAGFALSHYLLNEGHNVCAIDGLKISPLDFDVNKPIKNWNDIKSPLSKRNPKGFGGVAEYGITSRWDKNNLTLIRLLLERRKNMQIQGGIRFGSNLTTEQAFSMGFDHISLCLGAGRPNFVSNVDYFAKGIKSAADFLMNLQQGAAFRFESNSNLLQRLPAVVVGCGLTAIDSAVELLHYYPEQVMNFHKKWQEKKFDEQNLSAEDLEIANEFIAHAKLFEKAKTSAEKLQILQQIGGVTICYRNKLEESPAYRLNHEEIEHAMAIGVKFKELVSIEKIHQNQYGAVLSLELSNAEELQAKTVLMAIGTGANEFHDIDGIDHQDCDIFKNKNHKISHFGDCNPKYSGSVVKALASVKNGYQAISKQLSSIPSHNCKIPDSLKSRIHKVNILSGDVVELVVYSPQCAKNFKAGQFFRLQNYSHNLSKVTKPLALTGAYVDKKAELISLMILELGKSTKLCRDFKEGDEIVLMGPNGAPTTIVKDKKVGLIGTGPLSSIMAPVAKSLKENNCHVTYFAGYKKPEDQLYPERIQEYADQVIWSCEQEELPVQNTQELSTKGTIIDAILQAKAIGLLENIDQVICGGGNLLAQKISENRQEFFAGAEIIFNLNSPMQCMMKGICGQCIQKVNDERGYIFSCVCQEQKAETIDFEILKNRMTQNSLLEKI
jgi:NADPH-dependent glutamate synthase beta subunit-like oxidoreductase/NAD(P)H-flavin reductase